MAQAATAPTSNAPRLASSASTEAKPLPVPAKPKFDIGRPFRRLAGFVGGTVTGLLDGMANWGRKGLWLGGGAGLLAVMAGALTIPISAPVAILMGAAMGLVGGAVAGGGVGLITGGINGLNREKRKDKYADDLIAKAKAKSRAATYADYRDARRDYKSRNEYMLDRIFQQQRENNEETNTYFRDHVDHSRMGHHHHQQGF